MTNAQASPTIRRASGRAERVGRALLAGHHDDAPVTHRSFRRWASRVAVLGAVATATIVGPLTGAYASMSGSLTEAGAEDTGVVATLAGDAIELPEADELEADPNAPTRAMTAASRGYMREALECAVESEANGTLSAVMGGENTAPSLIMPAAEGTYRITSDYGPRTVPYPGMHEGTDFAGDLGTPLYAVADGTIVYAGGGKEGRSGQIVILRAEVDGATYDFWYGHMFTDGVLVKKGDTVSIGQKIAEIGNNGNSTGPHLHLEVHKADDTTTDPLAFLEKHDAQPAAEGATCA